MAASSVAESVCTFLTPEKQADLAGKANARLLNIIRANFPSQFASQSNTLTEFRNTVLAHGGLEIDYSTLIQDFHRHVPLSDYEAYRPFVDRFHSRPCKESETENLLAPGLPSFLISSSATSGTKPKLFPSYTPAVPSTDLRPVLRHYNPDNPHPFAVVIHCGYQEPVEVEREPGQVVQKVPICSSFVAYMRVCHGWNIDDDESRMSVQVPGYVAPWAAMMIGHYQSFLTINGLFSLACQDLGTIFSLFLTSFLDFIQSIDDRWDRLLDCIRDGTIPDLEGIEHVRTYLQFHFRPNPDRAAELRELGPPFSREGWAAQAWPNLTMVLGICSGPFSTVVPKVNSILGPNVKIRSPGYGSSEGSIGDPYRGDNNTFIMENADGNVLEFLDITLEGSGENVSQFWEVKTGNKYEIILTTQDGLWRYRLGDIVEIVGYDIDTGLPLLRYAGRKSLILRLIYAQVTDAHLLRAIQVINSEDFLPIQEFITLLDTRRMPQTVGFFVELSGPIGPSAHLAPQKLFDALAATNVQHKHALKMKWVRYPTIRLLKAGTFAEYRRWRLERISNAASSQIKVPVIAVDPAVEEWISDRVIGEF